MTQAKPKFVTFEEYLEYDDGTGNRYELIDGHLVALIPRSEPDDFIANLLFFNLVKAGLPRRLARLATCELQIPVLQKGDSENYYPDLIVLEKIHLHLTEKRLTIAINMPPPRLVAEVLNAEKLEQTLTRKCAQCAKRGIPEYWLIDRENQSISVLSLEGDRYAEVGSFGGDRTIISPQYPQLQLTPAQLFEN
ncbi:MAG: Uma2 family endonuclease [Plectolyngbya sp. WJT66-NPBG17]|jgi:Uma2 family endonuclease|nr:Uma2 family endonuclease [Plectolyngbya sp. WJT66-NPBG17]